MTIMYLNIVLRFILCWLHGVWGSVLLETYYLVNRSKSKAVVMQCLNTIYMWWSMASGRLASPLRSFMYLESIGSFWLISLSNIEQSVQWPKIHFFIYKMCKLKKDDLTRMLQCRWTRSTVVWRLILMAYTRECYFLKRRNMLLLKWHWMAAYERFVLIMNLSVILWK